MVSLTRDLIDFLDFSLIYSLWKIPDQQGLAHCEMYETQTTHFGFSPAFKLTKENLLRLGSSAPGQQVIMSTSLPVAPPSLPPTITVTIGKAFSNYKHKRNKIKLMSLVTNYDNDVVADSFWLLLELNLFLKGKCLFQSAILTFNVYMNIKFSLIKF
ncbi:hypothetical protein FF38_07339 [Lucilia cuprina]|uniref:Uncharacterized protein n=1 Tax=Lucilia cuprina TaxID=7375 RepID=A0A0L0BSR0_LUCCU|nr:hypothetical protein FF38_07339 [Lucilia cuprina]